MAHAISSDTKRLAVAGYDGLVLIRDLAPRKAEVLAASAIVGQVRRKLRLIPAPGPETPPPESSFHFGELTVRSLRFSPDGKTLAAGGEDHTVTLWDVAARQVRQVLRGHSASVFSLAFSPDGRTIAAASLDNTVTLWDVASGRLETVLKGHGGPVMTVAFSPDGRTLVSGSMERTIKLWNVSRGEGDSDLPLVGHSAGVEVIAFDRRPRTRQRRPRRPDHPLGRPRGKELGRIEPMSPAHPEGHPSHLRALAFSGDGRISSPPGSIPRSSCGIARRWPPSAR